jgi:hypothetical protein
MADNNPNKKDIQDAQSALDKYNDALRESINYAKELSKQVGKLPESFNFSERKNRELVKGADNYARTLQKTLALSEKVSKGKATERDITKQLGEIQRKYDEYRDANAASFESKRGRFFLAQKKAQAEVEQIEQAQLDRRNKINSTYRTLDILQEKIIDAEAIAASTTSSTQKQIQQDKIKFLKEKLKEENQTIAFTTGEIKSNEKILTQKKKEKEEVDKLIKNHKDITEGYKKQIKDNQALLAALREQNSLTGAVSKIYDDIKDKIVNTLKPLALITAAFDFLKKLAFSVSDQTTKLQKNLVLSNEEAYELRQDFNDIAVASGDAAVNTARLVEANLALGKQLGFNSRFTSDLNVQFVKLTKQIGLSEEAAGGLAKLSIATGSTLEESKNVALETSQALSSQFGIQLNQREVLEEVGKISGQTLAMLKASPQAIAQAVAQAKLLGTSLDTVRKQAASLLDFETSISNELQAELLTGRELNLERARTAALTGDLTTAMKELNNQNIDFNKFSNMNVIAQDKVAAALGLSSDELSDQLLKQQYLGKSVEEVAALEGEEVAKRLEALNAQDKFNLAIEKMQDLFGQVIGGPLGKLVDMMANLASSSAFVYGTLTAMAGISLIKLISSLVSVAATLSASAIAGTATASALTFGLAAAGIVAGIGVVAAAIGALTADAQSQVQEAGDMFSSKGKTIVSTKEGGLFSLSDNDDLAVAPGIGDMISSANKQTVIAQDNSEMLSKFDALIAKTDKMISGIDGLNRKDITVKANTQTIGTAQLMGNTNLA